MSMSKRDFIALADALKAVRPLHNPVFLTGWEVAVLAAADAFATQYPRFNRSRWLAYIAGECGPSGGTVKKPKTGI